MTLSIVILSEKGLEQSISPSGRSKKKRKKKEGETDRKIEMEREGATQRGSKQRENERKY